MSKILDLFNRKISYICIFVAVVILVALLPHYFHSGYVLRLMVTIGFSIATALCFNLVIGYMGYPSLCQSVFYGVGGYTMALVTLRLGLSPWIALLLSPLTGFVVGYLAAIPFLKLRSMFFAIGTLAFTGVVNAILVNLHSITGAEAGLRGIPRLVKGDTAYFYILMVLIILILFGTKILVDSYWGKIMVAIREDEDLAPHYGINTTKYKRLTFALTSAFTGLAGAMFISYQTYISSNYYTIGSSFSILACTVVGGGGSLLGPIIGALVVIGAPEFLREVLGQMYVWRPSFVGAVLVAVILLFPGGIYGGIQKLADYIRKRREK
jgi:branched-chain amino acid transport system permease protein